MPRKPILAGPVLNRDDVQSRLAGDDVMSRIIENDRERSGRRSSPAPMEGDPQLETELTNLQERKKESNPERSEDKNQAINLESQKESPVSGSGAAASASPATAESVEEAPRAAAAAAADREARLSKILEVAEQDEMIVVSVRVPRRLNDYVDQYVSRAPRKDPKRRYLKQDALTEALAAFVADHPMPSPEELF